MPQLINSIFFFSKVISNCHVSDMYVWHNTCVEVTWQLCGVCYLFLPYMGSGGWFRSSGLSDKCFYQLRHLVAPLFFFEINSHKYVAQIGLNFLSSCLSLPSSGTAGLSPYPALSNFVLTAAILRQHLSFGNAKTSWQHSIMVNF